MRKYFREVICVKCNIEYVGKTRQGKTKYYCTTHKSFAHDKAGNKLDECLWINKEIFDKRLNIKDKKINNIIIRYENILESKIPNIIIDGECFNGVLEYDDSLLTYKDFSGLLLARLNETPLEVVRCNHCGKYHSDNGMFSYTPHLIHLCLYCGHLFRAKQKNVGSELAMIYDIPKINLKENIIIIDDKCLVEYDIFNGTLLINGEPGNQVLLNGKKLSVKEFFNSILENEY